MSTVKSSSPSGRQGHVTQEQQNTQGKQHSLSQTQTLDGGEVWHKQTNVDASNTAKPTVTQNLRIEKDGKEIGALKYNDLDGDGRFGKGDKLIKASGVCADGQDGNKVAAKFFYDPNKPDAAAQTGFDYQDVTGAKTAQGGSQVDEYWKKIKDFFGRMRKESGSKDEAITDLNPTRADGGGGPPKPESAFNRDSRADFSTKKKSGTSASASYKKAGPDSPVIDYKDIVGGGGSSGGNPTAKVTKTTSGAPNPTSTTSEGSGGGKIKGAFAASPSGNPSEGSVAGSAETKKNIKAAVDEFYKEHPELEQTMSKKEATQMLIAIASFEAAFGTGNLDNKPPKAGTDRECFSMFNINKASAATLGINDPAGTLGNTPEASRSPAAVQAGAKGVLGLILKHQQSGHSDPVGAFMAEHRGGSTGLDEFNAGNITNSTYGTDKYMYTVKSIMNAYQNDDEAMSNNKHYWMHLGAV